LPRSILGSWATSPLTTELSWSRIGRLLGVTVGPNSADLSLGLAAHAVLLGERRMLRFCHPGCVSMLSWKLPWRLAPPAVKVQRRCRRRPFGAAHRRGGPRAAARAELPGQQFGQHVSQLHRRGLGHRFCNAGFTTGSDLDPKSGASPLMDAYGRTTEQAAQRHNVQRCRHRSSRDSVTWAATLLAHPEALVCE
jgi:hypothetical protein